MQVQTSECRLADGFIRAGMHDRRGIDKKNCNVKLFSLSYFAGCNISQ